MVEGSVGGPFRFRAGSAGRAPTGEHYYLDGWAIFGAPYEGAVAEGESSGERVEVTFRGMALSEPPESAPTHQAWIVEELGLPFRELVGFKRVEKEG